MKENDVRKFYAIPKCIMDDSNNWQYTLPTIAYLRSQTGYNQRSTVSIPNLINACGYKFDANIKVHGHYQGVISALNYLLENKYIEDAYDFRTEKPLKNFNNLKATSVINVFINEELCGSYKCGYIPIYTRLYRRFYDAIELADITLWRTFLVFCYLSKNIRDNVEYLDIKKEDKKLYEECITSLPRYFYCSEHQMLKDLDYGISLVTLQKALNFLDKNDIIHRKNSRPITRPDGKIVSAGSVYVFDGPDWKKELDAAAEDCRRKRVQYYKGCEAG